MIKSPSIREISLSGNMKTEIDKDFDKIFDAQAKRRMASRKMKIAKRRQK